MTTYKTSDSIEMIIMGTWSIPKDWLERSATAKEKHVNIHLYKSFGLKGAVQKGWASLLINAVDSHINMMNVPLPFHDMPIVDFNWAEVDNTFSDSQPEHITVNNMQTSVVSYDTEVDNILLAITNAESVYGHSFKQILISIIKKSSHSEHLYLHDNSVKKRTKKSGPKGIKKSGSTESLKESSTENS